MVLRYIAQRTAYYTWYSSDILHFVSSTSSMTPLQNRLIRDESLFSRRHNTISITCFFLVYLEGHKNTFACGALREGTTTTTTACLLNV